MGDGFLVWKELRRGPNGVTGSSTEGHCYDHDFKDVGPGELGQSGGNDGNFHFYYLDKPKTISITVSAQGGDGGEGGLGGADGLKGGFIRERKYCTCKMESYCASCFHHRPWWIAISTVEGHKR